MKLEIKYYKGHCKRCQQRDSFLVKIAVLDEAGDETYYNLCLGCLKIILYPYPND